MSWEEYAAREHVVPYVIDITHHSGGRLVYVGSRHLNDPEHLELKLIETLWGQVVPELALNEGGDPPSLDDREAAIRKFGEPGLVRHLAKRDGVPVRSFDPSWAEEVAELGSSFDCESLRLFYAFRQASHHNRNRVEPIEDLMKRVFAMLDSIPELRCGPRTLDGLRAEYAERFPGRDGLESIAPEWFDPVRHDHWLNEIARASSELRDRYIIEELTRPVLEGKRVFAVAGASHVVMQEELIRSLLQ